MLLKYLRNLARYELLLTQFKHDGAAPWTFLIEIGIICRPVIDVIKV